MRKLLILILVLSLASCSIPFVGKKKAEQPASKDTKTKTAKTAKGELVDSDSQPKPGDIKLVEGIEYIYARNRRYNMASSEPEYIWYRKDQYSPGLFESLRSGLPSSADKKERTELEKRIARLEGELKAKGTGGQGQPVQIVYAGQPGLLSGLPVGTVAPSFNYPSPKMKRRVLILPLSDQSNYKNEHLDDLATKKLMSRLDNSGTVICVDAQSIGIKDDPLATKTMGDLNTLYGIQAVVKGTLSDVYTTSGRVDGAENKEVSMAVSKISVDVFNTETGILLRQLSARNPFSLSREQGDMSPEKAKIKAIDLSIELLADDLLKVLLNLDWHARIASVTDDRIYINAGRMSGLEKGDVLEVFAPGDQVIDKTTSLPLGKTKGVYKGELEILETFGIDAAWGKAKKAVPLTATDLVYLKK